MKVFTEEFRKAAVQKYLGRGTRSVSEICEEIGVAKPTIFQWASKYGNASIMKINNRRPQYLSAEEKIKACFEYDQMNEENRGEFLRRNGLHSEHMTEWKNVCIDALSSARQQRASRTEVIEANRKIKELERELYRKDKALAEATALLVLKKKADLIWGNSQGE